jgi:hemoglobin-like flavoprotein
MTPKQIQLVQQSWAEVQPIAETAAALFYQRLFELDPALRALFKRDLEEQGRVLMKMIDVAVAGLSRLQSVLAAVQALGRRHAGYGVTEQHYDTVAEALLWTLEQGLGSAFDAEQREAWTAAYLLWAETMQAAVQDGSEQTAAA